MPENKWNIVQTNLLNTAKFVKSGLVLMVEPKPEPVSVEEMGKFGKQKMYIVNTREVGLVKLNQWQFLKVCEAFKGNFDSAVTVQF